MRCECIKLLKLVLEIIVCKENYLNDEKRMATNIVLLENYQKEVLH